MHVPCVAALLEVVFGCHARVVCSVAQSPLSRRLKQTRVGWIGARIRYRSNQEVSIKHGITTQHASMGECPFLSATPCVFSTGYRATAPGPGRDDRSLVHLCIGTDQLPAGRANFR